MELSEDGIIQKYGKNCGQCNRNYHTNMNLIAFHEVTT